MARIRLFDRALKVLGRHYAASFLKLVFPNQPVQLIGTLENVELSLPDQRIDFLHRIRSGRNEYLIHFEFQLRHAKDLPRRMFIYSAELTDQFRTPVISAVLYLERRKTPVPDSYVVRLGNTVVHEFNYPVLRLWDYEEDIRSGRLPELAPLLAMIAEDKTEAVLQIEKALILREPDARKRADALATAVMVASRYYDVNWLWDFFQEEVEQMRQATPIQDWIRQAERQARQLALQEGREEGREEGARQKARELLLRQLAAKFGRLPEAVEYQIQRIADENELDRLSIRVLTANSLEEMELGGKN